MITIRRQATRQTEMPTILERLANLCATDTRLRCSARVNFNQQSPGALSLVRKHVDKVRPSGVVNTFSEHSRSQSFDVQIFHGNQSVLVNKFSTQLVMEIGSLATDVDSRSLKNLNRFTSSVRAFLAPRYTPLCDPQSSLPFSIVPWIVYLRSVAHGGKVRQANIDTDSGRTKGQRLRFYLASEQRVPSSSLAFNSQRFDHAFDGPMHFDSHLPDLGKPEAVSAQCVSDLAKRDAVIATDRAKSWEPWRALHSLTAPEESLKRLVHTGERVFKYITTYRPHVIPNLSYRGELINLIKSTYRLAFNSPSVPAFLKSGVVKFAADRKRGLKGRGLRFGWINPVLKNLDHQWANYTN